METQLTASFQVCCFIDPFLFCKCSPFSSIHTVLSLKGLLTEESISCASGLSDNGEIEKC